jgi:RNA polymerase sigma factor (sigma-70 family)
MISDLNSVDYSKLCKSSLLSKVEEIELSRQVQRMMNHPSPVPSDVKKAGIAAKKKIISSNLRLVIFMAKKFSGRGVDIEDLISEGIIGLNRAAEKFDPSKGFRFSTYSCWWIKQSMNRAIANSSRTIRIPLHVTEKLNKVNKWKRNFYFNNNRFPNHSEVKEFLESTLEITYEDYQNMRLMSLSTPSLDASLSKSNDNDHDLLGIIQSPQYDNDISFMENHDYISQILVGSNLSEREKKVLVLHYFYDISLQEIGRRMGGLSRERIRQIKMKALKKCRKFVEFKNC